MRRFLEDRGGNFAISTSLLLVPLIGVAGLAIDIHTAVIAKTSLQAAADSAVLAAVGEYSAGTRQAMQIGDKGRLTDAIEDARKVFNAHAGNQTEYTLVDSDIEVVKTGRDLQAVFTFSAEVPTTLARIFGQDVVTISGEATAVFQTETFRDFYLLLDNTPSMGVAATPTEVTRMMSSTPDRCAFACHIVKDGVDDLSSHYHIAKRNGITTRIDVVGQATSALMTTAMRERKSDNQFRMAVYTFGEKAEDMKLLEVSPLTSDLASVQDNASKIDLMSTPNHGFARDALTDFTQAIDNLGQKMGVPGDGATAANPEKIVFFVSDGVGNYMNRTSCMRRTDRNRCMEPINTAACKALKDKGYRIAVLYTTYLPLPTNGFYRNWIAPFQPDIPGVMRDCASPGLYFEVSPSEGIKEAMSALFLKIANTPRLAS
jgi:Flp pilus assembly protein TadG